MPRAATARRSDPVGRPVPRVAPPLPVSSDAKAYVAQAKELGIELFPWQVTALRYISARFGDRWLFREVCELVARQNGKTEVLRPLIVRRLRAGRRIMHTAQDRTLPREVFALVAEDIRRLYPSELRSVRLANGQEQIVMRNGGRYRIVAPTTAGARGYPNDDVIVDEARELESWDFIGAAKPTMTASPDPQIIYLSNAGSPESVVLTALRKRATAGDPDLCYLEWSSAPHRRADDLAGWLEANPSYGHLPGIAASLESEYRAAKLGGTLSVFETEHLCRFVTSYRQLLVPEGTWLSLQATDLGQPRRASLGVAVDPDGTRASGAVAWKLPNGDIAVRGLFEFTGDPVDLDAIGREMKRELPRQHVVDVAHDPLTDAQLAKHFRKPKPITGRAAAAAAAEFVRVVMAGRLRWSDAGAVTDDLGWTARKEHDETGSFIAVRADDDRPITASLAAVRAVWLASIPSSGSARVW